jgi:glycosyltransferase involved in cell wall biosynthesis
MSFFSIIIPVYNSEQYLSFCVESILNQDYRDFEIILVDDGSTDNSPAICDEFAIKDKRVKVIHKPNGGISSARNVGLEAASGKYIVFADNDDLLPYGTLMVYWKEIENSNADIVRGDYKKITLKDKDKYLKPYHQEYKTLKWNRSELCSHGHSRFHVWGGVYRSTIAKKYYFPDGHLAEDFYYNALVYTDQNINEISYIHYLTYCYYMNEESVTHNWSCDQLYDMLHTISKAYELVVNRCDDISIKSTYLITYISQFCKIRYNIILRNGQHRELYDEKVKIQRILFRSKIISIRKKIMFLVILYSNSIYRMWLLRRDPTMRKYEESVKNDTK